MRSERALISGEYFSCRILSVAVVMFVNMSETDLELLARYARQNAEDAFSEIVRRHLNLVYSAAFRQVRSLQLAKEVAQSAFLKLANHAPQLPSDTVITAWLYQVTRREAIDVVRREARRQVREQVASEMNAMNANASDWSQVEPLLDEAMHALDETDRAAVLLRYFENKSLREVGATLGTSDDAAQKRVSRAVERLREFFVKNGVAVGASGLIVVISANAVQAAPAGLATTIATAITIAGTSLAATPTALAATTIVMTTLQKISITAVILAIGVTTTLVIQHQTQLKAHALKAAQPGGPTKPPPQTEFPQASWKFAGYADPESGYQSLMWAMSQGDVELTHESLTPATRAKWERNSRPLPKGEKDERLAQRTKQTELFRILDKQIVSDTETHLRIESVGASNESPVQEQSAKMIKVGNDWKFEGWVGN